MSEYGPLPDWRRLRGAMPILALAAAFVGGYIAGAGGPPRAALAQDAEDDDEDEDDGRLRTGPLPPNLALGIEDNWNCFVCHMDFETETLSADHVKMGVPCARCHDASEAHQMDEMLTTTPDFLFGRKEIEPLCLSCHEDEHLNPENVAAFLEEWHGKQRPNRRTITEESVCTDCHGEHILPK